MPAASRDQHSVPHGKLVAYESYIQVIKIFKFRVFFFEYVIQLLLGQL